MRCGRDGLPGFIHFGLILSGEVEVVVRGKTVTFNPILVWFYRVPEKTLDFFPAQLSIPLWSDFIQTTRHRSWKPKWSFQSHYGLILSPVITIRIPFSVLTFNPTMVWFYQYLLSEGKLCYRWLSIPLWSDFIKNPASIKATPKLSFQSHYGLILSQKRKNTSTPMFGSFNPTMVWFYRGKEKGAWETQDGLSIPLWSDFIWEDNCLRLIFLEAFNPTMVWFYRDFRFERSYERI